MKYKNSILQSLLAFILCLFIVGCATPEKTYDDDEVRKVDVVFFGTIKNVGTVTVKEDPNVTAALAGAVTGGVAGYVIGGNVGAIVGAAAGGVAGSYIVSGNLPAKKVWKATELTVELEDGKYIIIIVGTGEYFIKNDEVRILSLGEHYVRVQHI